MVTRFTVFGSCACRDIFFSGINKDYKKFFSIGEDGIRVSFISLMQEPVQYEYGSLRINPESRMNNNFSNWIKLDLEKRFIEVLKQKDFEYIMIDTYYDVNFGIIDLGNGSYITKNMNIEETEFYKNLNFKRTLTIQKDTKEYFKLWKENCNLFFEFIEKNCPDVNIILNPNRHVDKLLKSDGSIVPSETFKLDCKLYNGYRTILDEYILKNFDVDVLMFDDNICGDENHLWGPYSLHYAQEYYQDMTNQLNEIIERDETLNRFGLSDLNLKFRQLKREKLLLKFQLNYFEDITKIKQQLI